MKEERIAGGGTRGKPRFYRDRRMKPAHQPGASATDACKRPSLTRRVGRRSRPPCSRTAHALNGRLLRATRPSGAARRAGRAAIAPGARSGLTAAGGGRVAARQASRAAVGGGSAARRAGDAARQSLRAAVNLPGRRYRNRRRSSAARSVGATGEAGGAAVGLVATRRTREATSRPRPTAIVGHGTSAGDAGEGQGGEGKNGSERISMHRKSPRSGYWIDRSNGPCTSGQHECLLCDVVSSTRPDTMENVDGD